MANKNFAKAAGFRSAGHIWIPHYNTNALSFLVDLSKLPNNPESFRVVILAEIIGLQTGVI